MAGVSQPARFGEDWSDERVRGYLDRQPPAGENADFSALMTAYKHMRGIDFERFTGFFVAAGRDLSAKGPDGRSLLDIVREHPKSAEFVQILEAAGAR
ncbi:MAG: PA4642 family protein [Moraxellaceae bacterium]|nr:PA4642 family protein [Moraxellaceae bacterium]